MKSRILIYGAGAIGSIFAGKLVQSGADTTILARDDRYEEIRSHGLILRNALSGKTDTIPVKCMRVLAENDRYDYIIVAVQNQQIDHILPVLHNNRSGNIVFVVNNPLGYDKYCNAVGKERVMLGFPSAGGERKNGIVTYFIGTGLAKIMQSTTFAEVDGSITARLKELVRLFKHAGFEPTISKNMDAWQKTHVAFVVPIAHALIRFDSNNKKLAGSRTTINEMIHATREGFQALKRNGIRPEPGKLNYYYMPTFLLCTLYQILFLTKISEYSMAKHTLAAREEIDILDRQFLDLFKDDDFHVWKKLQASPDSF